MKIWKTEKEALECACMQTSSGKEDRWDSCSGEMCGHWLPRPCLICNGHGQWKSKEYTRVFECQACKGTGHDGSKLGRCGLINL